MGSFPGRSEENAICEPSGDQTGSKSPDGSTGIGKGYISLFAEKSRINNLAPS